ncbi:HAMP domain-containing protein [Macrococcoides canis]|uniref:Sensor protein SrrB n=2 Tax=Macrococcoides canis TaxID=1855823 RepID=A0A4R6C7E5_9STAP|nr:ATP-binding protein [Macrococcus canis]TDM18328.1 HAMP domain-containing protein [Macrococcus canis]TDM21627.1 HAMP domain-containing protein [Macrococcus canis]TDM23502.1 HAMP domain-containing protein [Macrococcus canis]TDM34802.1 HAMP domain-containing protein [Macrococcus canis]TDM38277.1 HAMP domain-containing protein [Macrococcus canis]
MKYINSVVIKLWLTILFIVTTVLIILSVALMSFINAYLMSESALTLKQQAEKVELVLMSRHDKSDAMNYVKELIENPAGLILITNKQDKNMSVEDPLKALMLKEIKKNKAFDDVYKKDETVVQSIEVDYQGSKHEYLLVGYPSQAFEYKGSAIFIYQDTNTISDAFNYIAIIIFLVALVLLILTTIFAFFLSTRITKPLIHLKQAAFKLARGERNEKIKVQSRDEIGELALAFNKMEEDITLNMNRISSERNLRDRLINAMEDGVLSFNMHLEKQLQNPMAEKFLDDINQQQIEDLSDTVNQVMQSEDTIYKEITTEDKHYVLIVSPVSNPEIKQGNGAVAIIRDMTEEKKVDQMKQMFIANVSHELRTPIQMLQGYTEAILDGIVSEKSDVDEFLNIILDESKRLNRLVNELLNVARIDAGEQNLNLEVVDIEELIERTVMNFKHVAEKHETELQIHYSHHSKTLLDYDKMIQVITNIVDNALRYTVAGDVISIHTDEDDDFLIIRISDTGVGIAPEHIDNIFERFYKVDQARTRGKHGTGLGLFIVKSIVESHHGSISVDSKVDKGTTFVISIPKVDDTKNNK